MRATWPLAALLMLAGVAQADQPAAITAHHGKIYETQQAGPDSLGFIEIDNAEAAADTLIGADCAIANHTSLVNRLGKPIDQLTIGPRKNLILAADGPHLLLQSTHFSIDPGGAIPCSLSFQNAGQISVYLYPIPAP